MTFLLSNSLSFSNKLLLYPIDAVQTPSNSQDAQCYLINLNYELHYSATSEMI